MQTETKKSIIISQKRQFVLQFHLLFNFLLVIYYSYPSFLLFLWAMYGLRVWSFSLNQTGMSLSVSRVEWQPLVVQSVFIASSSSPKSVWLGNECNWAFCYQWCVGPRVACGKGFLRSVPHHSLLELVKHRRWDLLGIIKPSSGKWKSDWPKQSCKCFMLGVN